MEKMLSNDIRFFSKNSMYFISSLEYQVCIVHTRFVNLQNMYGTGRYLAQVHTFYRDHQF